jgi:hypothetical protein
MTKVRFSDETKIAANEVPVELRQAFGITGQRYMIVYSPATHWDCFVEVEHGRFRKVVSKDVARDCGVVFDGNPITHVYMQQLWDRLPRIDAA